MKAITFILLLSPLFCIAQIPKDLPIDSAKYIKDSLKMDSLIELRAGRKYIKDSLHKDSLLKVAALKADSIRKARGFSSGDSTGSVLYYNGITLDSFPAPNDVLITGEQGTGLMILNVSYQGSVIHIECEHCYGITKDNILEIHFEK